jgi:hypothetical protein
MSNKSCLGEGEIFFKLFSKIKLVCEQFEKHFLFPNQLIWEILRPEVDKKNYKINFLIKFFDIKYLWWTPKIHQ